MSSTDFIPTVTVGDLIRKIASLYIAVIKKGWDLSSIPAAFLWGSPGIGKSQGVYQIAELIHGKTGRKVIVTDIRLSMFSPIDLRGVPAADSQKEFTIWLKPKIFDLSDSHDVINILFFDELSSAPQQVQAAAYQITLDHRIGEHKLPENCIIIGAGNRTIDKSVVFRMPNALANRLQHYEIKTDYSSWREWAIQNRVHPFVLGYLAFDNSKLCMENPPAEQTVFPTPRTWMFVSNILWIMLDEMSISDLLLQISALVGVDVGLSFVSWCKKQKDLPVVEEIFCGKRSKYPSSPDALYALVMSLISFVENKEAKHTSGSGISIAELDNMSVFASRFPADYQASLYYNLEKKESIRTKLSEVKLYKEWKRKYSFLT